MLLHIGASLLGLGAFQWRLYTPTLSGKADAWSCVVGFITEYCASSTLSKVWFDLCSTMQAFICVAFIYSWFAAWYFAIVLPCQVVTDCQLALPQAILWVGLLPCCAPYAFCKACRKARLPYTVSALAPLLSAMLPSPPWWLVMAGNATSSISFCQVQLLSLLHPYTTYCTLTQRTAPLHHVLHPDKMYIYAC